MKGLGECWVYDLGILGTGLNGQLGKTAPAATPHKLLWESVQVWGHVWESPVSPPPPPSAVNTGSHLPPKSQLQEKGPGNSPGNKLLMLPAFIG